MRLKAVYFHDATMLPDNKSSTHARESEGYKLFLKNDVTVEIFRDGRLIGIPYQGNVKSVEFVIEETKPVGKKGAQQ